MYFGGWGNCCCSSSTKICIVACSPQLPVYGAVVDLYSGTTLVASCTTDSTGCCTFTQTGSYTVKVYTSGALDSTTTQTLAGSPITIAIDASNYVCCGGYLIPQTLTLTDAQGSFQIVYYANYNYPIWYGGHSVDQLSCTVTTPNNVCVAASPTVGPVRVCYGMTCIAGNSPAFSVQRSWSWVYEQGSLNPIWYQDPTGFTPGQPCATSPPAACGNPHTDTASCSSNPSSTSPFTLSCTPVAASGNATADPVGGSVAISA